MRYEENVMKKWIGILLSAIIIAAVPAAAKMEVLAAPVEVGVTTLSDSAVFNQRWAERNLTITCGGKVWVKPIAELMGEQMRLYTEEGVGTTCCFVNTGWADAFLKQVDEELRAPEFVTPGIPAGTCYQLVEGFEPWYLGVVQNLLMTNAVNDINITLNNNTCKIVALAEAVASTAVWNPEGYVLAGTCTTSFQGSSAARINNIRIAAGNMNGYILPSGVTASLDTIFGRRTTANGYQSAGVYSGGRLVNGIGGGICQVSSTAYNALMNAGITVTMRYPHSSPVSYLPLGTDAAISAGTKDLQFRNDYPHAVRLETIVEGKNLTVNVYVKAEDMKGITYKLWAAKTSSMSATTYQTVYVNGVEAEVREVGRCSYRPLQN